jgi:hypothetical protein
MFYRDSRSEIITSYQSIMAVLRFQQAEFQNKVEREATSEWKTMNHFNDTSLRAVGCGYV